MKNLYANPQQIIAMMLVSTAIISCSPDISYQEAMDRNRRKIEDPERLGDATFLVEAKSLNMLEVKLAELATKSGYASAIVNLAKVHLDHHRNMEEDLEDVARKEKITLPASMNDKHTAEYHDVAKADRQDFDKRFIAVMKAINDENTQQYLKMATEARDADVRAFAARKLDMFRTHAEQMEKVENELLNTY